MPIFRQNRAQKSCLLLARQGNKLQKAQVPVIYGDHEVSTCTKPVFRNRKEGQAWPLDLRAHAHTASTMLPLVSPKGPRQEGRAEHRCVPRALGHCRMTGGLYHALLLEPLPVRMKGQVLHQGKHFQPGPLCDQVQPWEAADESRSLGPETVRQETQGGQLPACVGLSRLWAPEGAPLFFTASQPQHSA